MKRSESDGDQTRFSALMAGVRLDLVIAICALLISTLATAASWWQTRATYQQTQIIEEQLSAQVWPYLGINEGLVKSDTVDFSVENDGLGPAVVRSASIFVDGRERSSFVGVLHAILGPNLLGRRRRGEAMGLSLNSSGPGGVLRPGDSTKIFEFRSKTFAPRLIRAYRRIAIRTCYCAIVPGKCWKSNSASSGDPEPVTNCPNDPKDLLHVTPADLFERY